jgi:hypothetical protein
VTTGSTEDEILIHKFQPTLAAGGEKSDRYVVNLTHKELAENRMQFDIKVAALNDKNCEGVSTIFLDKERVEPDIKFQSSFRPQAVQARVLSSEEGKTITILPSNANINERSRFLVISKCTAKTFGSRPHLTFIDCGGGILEGKDCADRASLFTCQ